jgi:hypothetical protein
MGATMSEPPHWGAYARLQQKLARKRRIDDRTWGLEAGLNQLLDDLDKPRAEDNALRAVRSESRRERYRAALRREYPVLSELIDDGHDDRSRLQVAEAAVTKPDWSFLCALGAGHTYDELADQLGASAGGLRIRALRLRRIVRTAAE